MRDIIIMCPTAERAEREFKDFCGKIDQYIDVIRKCERRVRLVNGQNIIFKGETEGQRAIRGFHGDVIDIDEFGLQNNKCLDSK